MIVLVAVFVASALGRMTPGAGPPHATGTPKETVELQVPRETQAATFSSLDGAVELPRASDGHFYAEVKINGAPVRMLVDTGASAIALSREDAQSAGVATSIGMNDVVGRGADGAVRGQYVRLDTVELGPLKGQGLDAVVLNSGKVSLLGQSFLSKFAAVEITGDRMVLR